MKTRSTSNIEIAGKVLPVNMFNGVVSVIKVVSLKFTPYKYYFQLSILLTSAIAQYFIRKLIYMKSSGAIMCFNSTGIGSCIYEEKY